MEKDLMTIDELADALKVKKSWCYSRTRETGEGCMPRIKIGKYLRFNYQDVMDWIESQNKERL